MESMGKPLVEVEEPEEGEIIDDDESDEVGAVDVFEVISESSIPSSPVQLGVGKSVQHRDLLRAVSLSSISDTDSNVPSVISGSSGHFRTSAKPHHKRKRKKSSTNNRRRKLKRGHDIDGDLQKQFQRAIKIDYNSDLHVKPLENRLKSMIAGNNCNDKDKQEDEDNELKKLRELALLSKEKNNENLEDVKDEEQSKGKEDEELIQLRLDALKSAMIKKATERKKRKENKENDVNKDNKEVLDQEGEIKDKDEAPIEHRVHTSSIEEDVDIMRAMLLVSMSNKAIPKTPQKNCIQPPANKKPPQKVIQIKPKPVKKLIINLKDSDDSDTDQKINEKDPKIEINNLKIEEFLKTQRAAVEKKSKSDEQKDTDEILLDKSVVKLLPKSQQREYQMLKQKLLNARRKKLRRTSTKLVNNNNSNGSKVNNCVTQTVKSNNGATYVQKIDGNILQKTLEEMQVKKSGRFQMKGKYKALGPLLQKVNQASLDRQRCEVTIKTLLGELQKARDKLHATQQNYSNLLVKLKKAKSAIDRGTTMKKSKENFELKAKVLEEHKTSTPINKNFKSAKINENQTESGIDLIGIDVSTINISDSLGNNRENLNKQFDEVEMDKETKKSNPEEDIIKYVSPLDTKNSEQVYDPLIMYCPFELFGVCKDPECQFNHCSSKF